MKIKSILVQLFTIAAMAMSFGCASTGYQQADKTGDGIASFRAEVIEGKKAISETMKSLDQVAISANTDPRKAFEQYSASLERLAAAADRAQKRSQDMKAQGKAYFAQWEKEMAQVKNPAIRDLAITRKAKLQETFESIKSVSDPLKAKFDPWMSDLKDLQKYLGNDLTIAGVDAAKGLIAKTRTDGAEVQKSMDSLIAELNTVAATLTPAKSSK
jgi:hypothetical protein